MCDECANGAKPFDRRRALKLGSGGLAVAAGLSLGYAGRGLVRAHDATPPAEHQHAHWTYEGEEGPEHWGDLDPTYTSCSGGTHQSPIDVAGANGGDIANIEFAYQTNASLQLENNGHMLQVTVPAGSSITVEGKSYPLKQFHFHTPSEHTIDGRPEAMEMHLVHITDAKEIAVVGVMLAEGDESVVLKSILEAIPTDIGPKHDLPGELDLNALLPQQRTTFRYSGSLTTPPCTEGVHWLLMTEPMTVSAAQVEAFASIFEMDARPVQPLNDRVITEDTSP